MKPAMKTVVLDDDPTGTQSATNVHVLLESSADLLVAALTDADSVYVQTNSRAIDEDAAVALVSRVRADSLAAAERLGTDVQFVLRGDSTLRGHVFSETAAFLDDEAVVLFVPAFPDGGRTTEDGVHYVLVNGERVAAHESEYADDPVFGFGTAVLVDYVAEKSGRDGVAVPLATVRDGGLTAALVEAKAGSVVLPDAVTNDDIRLIAAATVAAREQGATIVVRSAAPLAAALAGVESRGLLPTPLVPEPVPTLLACGSHTDGATAQLAPLVAQWGAPAVISTEQALADPAVAAATAAAEAGRQLDRGPLAIVTSERVRDRSHNTLQHGERVMSALTQVVRELLPRVEVVISKGGITSADVASVGIGARSATVLGQVLPGVSVWALDTHDGRRVLQVVVPGNVGSPTTLTDIATALGLEPAGS